MRRRWVYLDSKKISEVKNINFEDPEQKYKKYDYKDQFG